MEILDGLKEYIAEHQDDTVFDEAVESEEPWVLHLTSRRKRAGRIVENLPYEISLVPEEGADGDEDEGELVLVKKHDLAVLYPLQTVEFIAPQIAVDRHVRKRNLRVARHPSARRHIKNKTLWPLLHDEEVIRVTILNGEQFRGVVTKFTRYELTLQMDNDVEVTILRHAVHNAETFEGRCLLKSFQQRAKDWRKSDLYQNEE